MRDLQAAFDRLNSEQRRAVERQGDTVVLAGPGSGKTDTLAIKTALILDDAVPAPRGVACITYNNDAVDEFTQRLAGFGVRREKRLFLGTVHSFCLNCIIRPYRHVVDPHYGPDVAVIADSGATSLFEQCLVRHLNENPRYYRTTFDRLRKAMRCNGDTSGFDNAAQFVVRDYETELRRQGLVDFDGMVLDSLDIVRSSEWVRRFLVSRFPWLIVDEYQDLGAPLHEIVGLLNRQGAHLFAVGDPDQTIYDFTGADPRYLNQLTQRSGFETIRLRFNYRSGANLIAAGQAALAPADGPREYEADPERTDVGTVEFPKAGAKMSSHAAAAVRAVQCALDAGAMAEEIAVLYQGQGALYEALRDALRDAAFDFVDERDVRFPSAPFCRWLRQLAAWSIAVPSERQSTFASLLAVYRRLRTQAGHDPEARLTTMTQLRRAARADADTTLEDWLSLLEESLQVSDLSSELEAEEPQVKKTWTELQTIATEAGRDLLVRDFALEARVHGKVVLTTLHGSKGRQFDIVVMPGLAEGLFPRWRWNRKAREMQAPRPKALRESRRRFYVGFTRARLRVVLIWSPSFINKYGYQDKFGCCRFVKEIHQRLQEIDVEPD